ncbi:MAG: long-chain fatty acid--CoA ligase [Candidatus Rokuibacteriota bacterium]|nr:MAG: long-chain fatty acid--CoA ligase [Candidatus Rokubacteria bacterium]
MFRKLVVERGDLVAMREKTLGIWRAITWRQFGDRARRVGLGLVSLGLAKGECAAILSGNNPEWLYADMGIVGAGGVSVGIYPTDAAAQVEYVLQDSRSTVVFVEDEEQLDKVLRVRAQLPGLRRIVIFDMEGLADFSDPMALSLDAFIELGADHDRRNPGLWELRLGEPRPDELAILVYTSGTTGPPKGAMISHRNIIFQVEHGTRLLPAGPGDERLSFLPMCHVAERVVGVYYSLFTGTIMNFAESVETVPENVREVQPTVFGAVPRIWEKFYSAVTIAMAEATPLAQWAYRAAIGLGYRVVERRLGRRPIPPWLRLAYRFADVVVLKNIRKTIGIDRCRYLATGAAPISPDLVRWYLALGRDMLEVYGQTENTGLATVMPPDRIKLGTVGLPVPYGELRISPLGEILLRGDHVFMGYYNQPEKTAEVIVDGWLHTGDVGTIDEDGYVRITDRMRDIIITSGGKNVTPSEIENELKFSPFISDAVVIGDGRKYLTCLIMIDHDNVATFAQDHDVPFTNFGSLTRARPVLDLIAAEVEKVNRKFARVETIKSFRLIEHQLDPEDPELTPTMKLKRTFVNRKYRDLINSMYDGG